jgi:hypothetical protein
MWLITMSICFQFSSNVEIYFCKNVEISYHEIISVRKIYVQWIKYHLIIQPKQFIKYLMSHACRLGSLQEFYGFPTKYLVGIVSIFVGNVTFPTTVPTNCFVGIKVTIPTTFPTKLVGKVFVSVATWTNVSQHTTYETFVGIVFVSASTLVSMCQNITYQIFVGIVFDI